MIYLDLDGVLADFVGATLRIHDRQGYHVTKWDYFTDWGMTRGKFWLPIRERGDKFYDEDVRKLPWCDELWEICRSASPDVSVLSCAMHHHQGYGGKRRWVNQHMGRDVEVNIASRKWMLAQPGRLLIDDKDANVSEFQNAGGSAILFPQPWNANRHLMSHRMIYVQSMIRDWECKYHTYVSPGRNLEARR